MYLTYSQFLKYGFKGGGRPFVPLKYAREYTYLLRTIRVTTVFLRCSSVVRIAREMENSQHFWVPVRSTFLSSISTALDGLRSIK
jgi:hypothetical protein